MNQNKTTNNLVLKQVEAFIIDYILDNTSQENTEITADSNFINEHLLDSFATLSMIMTLESQFSIKLTPQELADEKMRVVKELAANVASKVSCVNAASSTTIQTKQTNSNS